MMSEKFKGTYRIKSARLKNWDYSWNAMYFVTICTQDREFYFGVIVKGEMILSTIGEIAQKYWEEIPKHFPFVELNEFVVMPNHIHGIITIINDSDIGNDNIGRDAINRVSTVNRVSTERGGITGMKNPMLSNNLSKIIRWYKGRVSFESRKIHADFRWQARFHDHIIRNDESFQKIRGYIINNPLKWTDDKFNNGY